MKTTITRATNPKEWDLDWYCVEQPEKKRRVPRWQRSVAVDFDGEIWVPAVYAGNERAVVLCMAYHGTENAIFSDNHVYVRAAWMQREYPKTIELLDKIRRRVREITDRQNDDWLSRRLRGEAKKLQ